VYTMDELNAIAKKGGKAKADILTRKGKPVTKKSLNVIRDAENEIVGLAGRTFNRFDDGDGVKILIDRDEISKTIGKIGPDEKVKYGIGRKGIDQDQIDDFEDYVDFILDHEAVHALAYADEAPELVQKLHNAKDELLKAGKKGKIVLYSVIGLSVLGIGIGIFYYFKTKK